MATYTYSIYDSNPQESDGNCWPSHNGIEIEASDDSEAREIVQGTLDCAAAGLSTSDGYEVGQRLYTTVTREDGSSLSRAPTHVLTEGDLG